MEKAAIVCGDTAISTMRNIENTKDKHGLQRSSHSISSIEFSELSFNLFSGDEEVSLDNSMNATEEVEARDPCNPTTRQPSQHQPTGMMTILASSSPEIKALQFAKTPTFQSNLNSLDNDDHNLVFQQWQSEGREAALTGTSFSPEEARVGAPPTLVEAERDLVASMRAHTLHDVAHTSPIKRCHHNHHKGTYDDNKENRDPNIRKASSPKHLRKHRYNSLSRRSPGGESLKPLLKSRDRPGLLSIRACSLHRRVSYDSLPSPAEINHQPTQLQLNRKTSSTSIFAFPSQDFQSNKYGDRNLSEQRGKQASRSHSLTMGFR